MQGEVSSVALGGALNLLWRYEQGVWHRGGAPNPSPSELLSLLELHPTMRDSVRVGANIKHMLAPSIAGVVHYLFSRQDADLASLFFDGLREGTDLRSDDPVRLLRERLLRDRLAKGNLPRQEILAITIKAWNATRRGQPMISLRWRTTGDKPEPFPTIL